MFFIGLTGGIASGKSTVTQILIENGLPVIDADSMARKVVEPGKKAWKKLKKEFGDEIFHPDGTLNRNKLGEIIFANTEKRKRLNLITHPEIIKEMVIAAIKVGLRGYPFVILDIPLLYETGELVGLMYKVIVVNCPQEQQIERLVSRNNLTVEEAKLRIACQMSLETKCQMADFVVENSASVEDTKEQVEKIIRDLKRMKYHYRIRFYIFLIICAIVLCVYYGFSIFKK